jgi:high-affinity iron transporter
LIAGFLIALREGVEAALIVAIILSYLKKVNADQLARPVYIGTALGIIGSAAVGGLFLLLSVEFEGTGEQVFEGSTMLLAAAILTSMILWMSRNSKAYSSELGAKVSNALTSKHAYGLAGLAFVSILREGIETVLFLGSTSFTSSGIQTLFGGALGLLAAVVIGIAIIKYSVRMNMRAFFNATGVLLVFFAAGLVANGIGEFGEAGIVPPLVDHVWNTGWLISGDSDLGKLLQALFGYSAAPSLAQIIGYAAYWVTVIVWIYGDVTVAIFRKLRARSVALEPAESPGPEE